jgi:predicted nucleotide-binding protein
MTLAYLFFAPDDEVKTRDIVKPTARDNVIFEAGLFIGKLGRFRSFVVKPRHAVIQIPSDLSGLSVADYDSSRQDVVAALGPASSKIAAAIRAELEHRA